MHTLEKEKAKMKHDQVHPARQVKLLCNCKMSSKPSKLKCLIFSEAERTEIFNYFRQILEMWDARKHYVAAMADVGLP